MTRRRRGLATSLSVVIQDPEGAGVVVAGVVVADVADVVAVLHAVAVVAVVGVEVGQRTSYVLLMGKEDALNVSSSMVRAYRAHLSHRLSDRQEKERRNHDVPIRKNQQELHSGKWINEP